MVTARGAAAAADQHSADALIVLIEFDGEGIDDPFRFALNDANIAHAGQTYFASGFQYKPPPQTEDRSSVGRLRLDNVDRVLSDAVRGLTEKPQVQILEVLAATPDIIEETYPVFTLFDIQWDIHWMEGAIGVPDDKDAPLTDYKYTPAEAPALYGL